MDRAHEKRIRKQVEAVVDGAKGAVSRLADVLDGMPAAVLVELGAHQASGVRQALAQALWGRNESELADLIVALANDKQPAVRTVLAKGLETSDGWQPPEAAIARMLGDTEPDPRWHALLAIPRHTALVERVRPLARNDRSWLVRQRGCAMLVHDTPVDGLPVLLACLALDGDDDVRAAAAVAADTQLKRASGWPADAERPDIATLAKAHEHVDELHESQALILRAWLTEIVSQEVDTAKLATFGTDLTALAEAGQLHRAHGADQAVDAMLDVLNGQGSRSVVLLGKSGSGKTAIIHELVHRLANAEGGGWRVLRMAPADLMSGTLYIGEWQTKVTRLLEAARAPKKVLIYVPNLHELSMAGSSSRSDMNVASMLAPHIESGAIALCGEATPETWQRGLGQRPELRRLFVQIDIQPSSRQATRGLLEEVTAEAGTSADDAFYDQLMDLADFYVQGSVQPGRALGLLRRLLETRDAEELTTRDVLDVLHDSTGIPTRFLDDSEALDLEEVRAFLESRVMGQPEAVDSVLDLVTLVKAGLTDDSKPAGVLLFVGPTGVGKTELARALAELLFGDPARLLRFDMSEYASYESYERLIGKDGRSGQLTSAVREHPFSVLLLDEVEKAHSNVFDLCLGLFDAGRLTDGAGRTVDFRRTIIILTSNIGAAVPLDKQVGFGGGHPPPPDRASIDRDLRRSFRPEFLNRLDRIVSFRPLGAETAERIARKELAAVLVRGGIARRDLTLDVDPGVFTLLMRQGYSPAFGARPLKRTVERLVVLPVARAITSGQVHPGALLRLVAQGETVAVETVSADEAVEPSPDEPSPSLRRVQDQVAGLVAATRPFETQKSALLERSNAPDFWDDRRAAVRDLDAIHRLDRVIQDVRELARQVALTAGNRDPDRQRHFLTRHESEAGRLQLVVQGGDLSDAYLTLSRVQHERGGLDGVSQLGHMYQRFARRLGFEVTVLDDHDDGNLAEDTITLGLYGPGALAVLSGEAGLHQLVRDPTDKDPERARDLIRVEVLAAPSEAPLPPREVTLESRELDGSPGRLVAARRHEIHVLHRPSMVSVRARVDRPAVELEAALLGWLHARRDAQASGAAGTPPVVRRYVLGPSPRVSDRRSGRTTGNIAKVFRGELEPFCAGTGA